MAYQSPYANIPDPLAQDEKETTAYVAALRQRQLAEQQRAAALAEQQRREERQARQDEQNAFWKTYEAQRGLANDLRSQANSDREYELRLARLEASRKPVEGRLDLTPEEQAALQPFMQRLADIRTGRYLDEKYQRSWDDLSFAARSEILGNLQREFDRGTESMYMTDRPRAEAVRASLFAGLEADRERHGEEADRSWGIATAGRSAAAGLVGVGQGLARAALLVGEQVDYGGAALLGALWNVFTPGDAGGDHDDFAIKWTEAVRDGSFTAKSYVDGFFAPIRSAVRGNPSGVREFERRKAELEELARRTGQPNHPFTDLWLDPYTPTDIKFEGTGAMVMESFFENVGLFATMLGSVNRAQAAASGLVGKIPGLFTRSPQARAATARITEDVSERAARVLRLRRGGIVLTGGATAGVLADEEVHAQYASAPEGIFLMSPDYQAYLAQGDTPERARRKVINDVALTYGLASALNNGVIGIMPEMYLFGGATARLGVPFLGRLSAWAGGTGTAAALGAVPVLGAAGRGLGRAASALGRGGKATTFIGVAAAGTGLEALTEGIDQSSESASAGRAGLPTARGPRDAFVEGLAQGAFMGVLPGTLGAAANMRDGGSLEAALPEHLKAIPPERRKEIQRDAWDSFATGDPARIRSLTLPEIEYLTDWVAPVLWEDAARNAGKAPGPGPAGTAAPAPAPAAPRTIAPEIMDRINLLSSQDAAGIQAMIGAMTPEEQARVSEAVRLLNSGEGVEDAGRKPYAGTRVRADTAPERAREIAAALLADPRARVDTRSYAERRLAGHLRDPARIREYGLTPEEAARVDVLVHNHQLGGTEAREAEDRLLDETDGGIRYFYDELLSRILPEAAPKLREASPDVRREAASLRESFTRNFDDAGRAGLLAYLGPVLDGTRPAVPAPQDPAAVSFLYRWMTLRNRLSEDDKVIAEGILAEPEAAPARPAEAPAEAMPEAQTGYSKLDRPNLDILIPALRKYLSEGRSVDESIIEGDHPKGDSIARLDILHRQMAEGRMNLDSLENRLAKIMAGLTPRDGSYDVPVREVTKAIALEAENIDYQTRSMASILHKRIDLAINDLGRDATLKVPAPTEAQAAPAAPETPGPAVYLKGKRYSIAAFDGAFYMVRKLDFGKEGTEFYRPDGEGWRAFTFDRESGAFLAAGPVEEETGRELGRDLVEILLDHNRFAPGFRNRTHNVRPFGLDPEADIASLSLKGKTAVYSEIDSQAQPSEWNEYSRSDRGKWTERLFGTRPDNRGGESMTVSPKGKPVATDGDTAARLDARLGRFLLENMTPPENMPGPRQQPAAPEAQTEAAAPEAQTETATPEAPAEAQAEPAQAESAPAPAAPSALSPRLESVLTAMDGGMTKRGRDKLAAIRKGLDEGQFNMEAVEEQLGKLLAKYPARDGFHHVPRGELSGAFTRNARVPSELKTQLVRLQDKLGDHYTGKEVLIPENPAPSPESPAPEPGPEPSGAPPAAPTTPPATPGVSLEGNRAEEAEEAEEGARPEGAGEDLSGGGRLRRRVEAPPGGPRAEDRPGDAQEAPGRGAEAPGAGARGTEPPGAGEAAGDEEGAGPDAGAGRAGGPGGRDGRTGPDAAEGDGVPAPPAVGRGRDAGEVGGDTQAPDGEGTALARMQSDIAQIKRALEALAGKATPAPTSGEIGTGFGQLWDNTRNRGPLADLHEVLNRAGIVTPSPLLHGMRDLFASSVSTPAELDAMLAEYLGWDDRESRQYKLAARSVRMFSEHALKTRLEGRAAAQAPFWQVLDVTEEDLVDLWQTIIKKEPRSLELFAGVDKSNIEQFVQDMTARMTGISDEVNFDFKPGLSAKKKSDYFTSLQNKMNQTLAEYARAIERLLDLETEIYFPRTFSELQAFIKDSKTKVYGYLEPGDTKQDLPKGNYHHKGWAAIDNPYLRKKISQGFRDVIVRATLFSPVTEGLNADTEQTIRSNIEARLKTLYEYKQEGNINYRNAREYVKESMRFLDSVAKIYSDVLTRGNHPVPMARILSLFNVIAVSDLNNDMGMSPTVFPGEMAILAGEEMGTMASVLTHEAGHGIVGTLITLAKAGVEPAQDILSDIKTRLNLNIPNILDESFWFRGGYPRQASEQFAFNLQDFFLDRNTPWFQNNPFRMDQSAGRELLDKWYKDRKQLSPGFARWLDWLFSGGIVNGEPRPAIESGTAGDNTGTGVAPHMVNVPPSSSGGGRLLSGRDIQNAPSGSQQGKRLEISARTGNLRNGNEGPLGAQGGAAQGYGSRDAGTGVGRVPEGSGTDGGRLRIPPASQGEGPGDGRLALGAGQAPDPGDALRVPYAELPEELGVGNPLALDGVPESPLDEALYDPPAPEDHTEAHVPDTLAAINSIILSREGRGAAPAAPPGAVQTPAPLPDDIAALLLELQEGRHAEAAARYDREADLFADRRLVPTREQIQGFTRGTLFRAMVEDREAPIWRYLASLVRNLSGSPEDLPVIKAAQLAPGQALTASNLLLEKAFRPVEAMVRKLARKAGLNRDEAYVALDQVGTIYHALTEGIPHFREQIRLKAEAAAAAHARFGDSMTPGSRMEEARLQELARDRDYWDFVLRAHDEYSETARPVPMDGVEAAAVSAVEKADYGEGGYYVPRLAGGVPAVRLRETWRQLLRIFSEEDLLAFKDTVVRGYQIVNEHMLETGAAFREDFESYPDFVNFVAFTLPKDKARTQGAYPQSFKFNPRRLDYHRQGSRTASEGAITNLARAIDNAADMIGRRDFDREIGGFYELVNGFRDGRPTRRPDGLRRALMNDEETDFAGHAKGNFNLMMRPGWVVRERYQDSKGRWRRRSWKYYFEFADNPEMTAVLEKALADRAKAGRIVRAAIGLNRAHGLALTKLKMSFAPGNLVKDLGERMINQFAYDRLTTADGGTVSGWQVFRKMGSVLLNPDFYSAYVRSFVQGRKVDTPMGRIVEEFKTSPANYTQFSHIQNLGRDVANGAELRREILEGRTRWRRIAAAVKEAGPVRKINAFLDGWNNMFNSFAPAVQYAAMRLSNVRGKDASHYTTDMMNFYKRGDLDRVGSSFTVFYRPVVQGGVNLLRAVTPFGKSSAEARLRGGMAFLGLTALAFLLQGFLRALGDDDDDGDVNRYDALPFATVGRSVVMFAGDGGHFKLPLPYGIAGAAYGTGTAIHRMSQGLLTPQEAASHSFISVMRQVAPETYPGYPAGDQPFAFTLQTFLPQIIRPFVDLAVNRNYFGGRIYGGSAAVGVRDFEKGYMKTATAWHDLARTMYEITGGLVDATPETWRHLITQYLWGPLAAIQGSLDEGRLMPTGHPTTASVLGPALGALGANAFWGSGADADMALLFLTKDRIERRLTRLGVRTTNPDPDTQFTHEAKRDFVARNMRAAGMDRDVVAAYLDILDYETARERIREGFNAEARKYRYGDAEPDMATRGKFKSMADELSRITLAASRKVAKRDALHGKGI